jgi:hypothetical protein
LTSRALLLLVFPVPEPMIRDEFSYILAAKTFASGRLANPTHPYWVHFEAPYTIHKPSYVSMYPPGQGLVLAFGQIAAGHPWWGVWLVTGLMCGAFCWMLQGWFPPSWALFGAVVAALRFGIFSYWMNSYWGGSLAALGGALALGALPRLRKGLARYSFVLGLGLVVMAITRPYEGLVLAIGIGAAGVWWLLRRTLDPRAFSVPEIFSRRVIVPASLVLVAGLGGLSYYCLRTTGNALVLPFNVFVAEYWGARHFIPMELPPERTYRHPVFQAMDRSFRDEHARSRSVTGYLRRNVARAFGWWLFYCGPILSIPVAIGHRFLLDRRVRPLLIITAIFAFGLSWEVSRMPHYAAPFTAVWIALWVQSARHTAVHRYGQWIAVFVPAALAIVLLIRTMELTFFPPRNRESIHSMSVVNWCCVPTNSVIRASVERELRTVSGRDLVFFQLPADRWRQFDWVYNDPDIDAAEIIWARSMSTQADSALAARYPDRRVWRIDATAHTPKLESYSPRR